MPDAPALFFVAAAFLFVVPFLPVPFLALAGCWCSSGSAMLMPGAARVPPRRAQPTELKCKSKQVRARM